MISGHKTNIRRETYTIIYPRSRSYVTHRILRDFAGARLVPTGMILAVCIFGARVCCLHATKKAQVHERHNPKDGCRTPVFPQAWTGHRLQVLQESTHLRAAGDALRPTHGPVMCGKCSRLHKQRHRDPASNWQRAKRAQPACALNRAARLACLCTVRSACWCCGS